MAYGISGKLLRFIESFLRGRYQRVRIESEFSDWAPVSSGVPQGSVLGPLLWLIYINDFPDVVGSSVCKLYADDSKLYGCFPKNVSSSGSLQLGLCSVSTWTKEWQLSINSSKCNVLKLGFRGRDMSHEYTFDDSNIQNVSSCLDLGVTMSSTLTFTEHSGHLVTKATSKSGLVYRAFASRSKVFMINMLKGQIRPLLESNTEVWSPLHKQDIDRLENVQRSFTKRIGGFWELSYSERLNRCDIETLEMRRLKRDLVLVYKIIHNLVKLSFDDFFAFSPQRGLRGHPFKLYPKQASTTRVLHFFANRVVNPWNNLPTSLVSSTNLNRFKIELNNCSDLLVPFMRGRAYIDS